MGRRPCSLASVDDSRENGDGSPRLPYRLEVGGMAPMLRQSSGCHSPPSSAPLGLLRYDPFGVSMWRTNLQLGNGSKSKARSTPISSPVVAC